MTVDDSTDLAPTAAVASAYVPPDPVHSTTVPMPPDSVGYRVKTALLGEPLHSDELEHQRLGKPTALAVFASDNLSSSAYATEEILHVLVPLVGLAAFSLVVPITVAMIVVLAFLILSYRETIKEYPSAGGAYLVTRDNFGIVPALEIDLVPVGSLYAGGIFFTGDDAPALLHRFRQWAPTLPEEVGTSIAVMRMPPMEELPPPLRGVPVVGRMEALSGAGSTACDRTSGAM